MPAANKRPAPTRFLPLSNNFAYHPLSEDVDEEEDEDEEKEEVEENDFLPTMPQEAPPLSLWSSGAPSPSGGHTLSVSGLDVNSDEFNPDWTDADAEFTSLAFGKKTASFVCKSTS